MPLPKSADPDEYFNGQIEKCLRLFGVAPHGVFVVSATDGKMLFVNKMFSRITGFGIGEIKTVEDWLKKNFPNEKERKDADRFIRKQPRKRKKLVRFEIVNKDGEEKIVTIQTGRISRNVYAVALNDVTKEAKDEKSLTLMKVSVDQSRIPVFWLDSEGNIVYANNGACKNLGYKKEELLALKVFDITTGLTPENWKVMWNDLKKKKCLFWNQSM